MTANATARSARVRTPHTLTIHLVSPPVTLRFWTAQGIDLARQAACAESEGRPADAKRLWGLALEASPADDITIIYCIEHTKGAS